MDWGPESGPPDEGDYLRELAVFVSTRQDGGLAVLWPRYERTAVDPDTFTADIVRLAGELERRVGRTVRAEKALDGGRRAEAEVLIVQGAGSIDVSVAPSRTIRLLAGEVLYLPRGSAYSVERQAHSHYGVVTIDPPGPAP